MHQSFNILYTLYLYTVANAIMFLMLYARRIYATHFPGNTVFHCLWQLHCSTRQDVHSFHVFFFQGFNICIPLVDKIAYIQSLKEIATEVPDQSAITSGKIALTQRWLCLSLYKIVCSDAVIIIFFNLDISFTFSLYICLNYFLILVFLFIFCKRCFDFCQRSDI